MAVLIGAGQINDRDSIHDSLALMHAAAMLAGQDAGPGLLGRTDWLGVVSQIAFPEYGGRLAGLLADSLGIGPAHASETAAPTGDSPILLMNQAANAIASGQASVALIVGGEALRTAGLRAAQARGAAGDDSLFARHRPPASDIRSRYGLLTPADIYPLYENAARAAYGQTLAEAQQETGVIWSGLSQVAARNPHAWLQQARAPDDIVVPSAANRPIAHPYTKLMVANAAVNQGAALLIVSEAVAEQAGIARERWVYVGAGAAAYEADNPLLRSSFSQSAAMKASLDCALRFNGLRIGDIDHLELYSCFPCVPKMARRILGTPAEAPTSVVGGLTFGGGPIGNYMTHAAACMMLALRRGGMNGLLFANGGYATHNHTILLSRIPPRAELFPQAFDVQAEADASRAPGPDVEENYAGIATIETFTVPYDRSGAPRTGVVIARTPHGTRTIAAVPPDDGETIGFLTDGRREPVGTRGVIEGNRWVKDAVPF